MRARLVTKSWQEHLSIIVHSPLLCQLGIDGEPTSATISAVGEVQAIAPRQLTNFTIHSHLKSKFSCRVNFYVVPHVCSYSPPQSQLTTELEYLSHPNLVDLVFLDKTEIQVLLGANVHTPIVQGQIVRGKPAEPIDTQIS